jgi:hypothetical protein
MIFDCGLLIGELNVDLVGDGSSGLIIDCAAEAARDR